MKLAQPAAAAAADDDDVIDALAQIAFATMAVLSKAAADNDLSLTQLRAIEILRDRRLRMSELAELLGLEKSTLSGLVLRAEKRGLLQRVPDDGDRRSVRVTIAPDGAQLALSTRATIGTAMMPLIDALDGAEQRQLQELLERMLARVRFAAPPPGAE
ncbi:MarR family winged helix-turn-helix transcriptional regulator [Gryllotalpicola reticulitermitis]|uniref:MarR family winged helix-turn-helix transcriptional regulator n=1 Tax=Gryllotalpicola reticulitermitis TaxID=1184153 RepID=A0ABV8Q9Z6_9MICO